MYVGNGSGPDNGYRQFGRGERCGCFSASFRSFGLVLTPCAASFKAFGRDFKRAASYTGQSLKRFHDRLFGDLVLQLDPEATYIFHDERHRDPPSHNEVMQQNNSAPQPPNDGRYRDPPSYNEVMQQNNSAPQRQIMSIQRHHTILLMQ